jgi:starvation-inducible DNA-binding protein
MTSSNRRSPDQVREFDAPTKLSESLQQVLVDLIELHLQGTSAICTCISTWWSTSPAKPVTPSPNACAP